MIVYLQWKDPDFSAHAIIDGKRVNEFHYLPKDIQERLYELGVASEYLAIKVDTETGHVEFNK